MTPDLHIEKTFGKASPDDLVRIIDLLEEAKLPTSGVSLIIDQFLVIRAGRESSGPVLAAGAIEPHGPDGLLRSLVVDSSVRGLGLGKRLTEYLLLSSDADLYLLTETAESFFELFGFECIDRAQAPDALRASEEFRCLCPESAAFMRRLSGPKAGE
ncbi:MAG: GNAT family N-acetyltransferase [Bacteroidetes bacterium]|nr:GNAT family N-acetyltransferase [Bacteroidota bacterium]